MSKRAPRPTVRVECGCRCGAWWYSPPADPRQVYLNKAHAGRIRRTLPEWARCGWPECGVEFTKLPLLGRPQVYCSAACKRLAERWRHKLRMAQEKQQKRTRRRRRFV